MKMNPLILLTLGLVVAICGVIGYKLLLARQPANDEALPATHCNPAAAPCSAVLPDGGKLDFSISPNPIRPLLPLNLIVMLSGAQADRIDIDFDGTQMSMGMNRASLTGNNSHASNYFNGQTILPVCVTGSMEWSATIRLTTKNRTLAIPFHFEVSAR